MSSRSDNTGPVVAGAFTTDSPLADFSLHDNLPPMIKKFFQNSALVWGANDYQYYSDKGYNDAQVLALLVREEQRVLALERTKVWGNSHPLLPHNPTTGLVSRRGSRPNRRIR